MPDAGATAEAPAAGAGGGLVQFLVRMVLFYFVYNMVFGGRGKGGDSGGPSLSPLFHHGELLDVTFYVNENSTAVDPAAAAPTWEGIGVPFDAWSSEGDDGAGGWTLNVSIPASASVKANGTLYGHAWIARHGTARQDMRSRPQDALYAQTRLTRYRPRIQAANTYNLIDGSNATAAAAESPTPTPSLKRKERWVAYWYPNVTLNLIDDQSVYRAGQDDPHVLQHLRVDRETSRYYPIVYWNDFWLLKDDLIAVNASAESLPLYFSFKPLPLWKWRLMVQFEQSFKLHEQWGSMASDESEILKRMILETNVYLLALTFTVSILHTVFEFLAFKNDVSFWRNRKDLTGISVRSLFTTIFMQAVILLYLMDNDTSWLILGSSAIGLLIDVWKLSIAVSIEVDRARPILGLVPRIRFRDRDSYVSRTREYDREAFRYLAHLLVPLVLGFSLYSLLYDTHKGWYSWLLGSLVGAVYTFGFIMMTPQLWINYKLRSVAHLPWRMLVYKTLSTVIDDLFSFVIRMPTMHRLACFRDDAIFAIYLYQRWKYPVDHRRRNEYQGGDAAPPREDAPAPGGEPLR